MARTHDFTLCHEFLMHYIEIIKEKITSCVTKLSEQTEYCPIIEVSFEIIDEKLKMFVDRQRNYLLRTNTTQLNKFIMMIQHKTIDYPNKMDIQNSTIIQELLDIRQQQIKIWEQQLLLELRVSCQFLPIEYDQLEEILQFNIYSSLPSDKSHQLKYIQLQNQHFKTIQEAKRQWLNLSMSIYEIKLQTYEQQFQEKLNQFNQLTEYMTIRTKELKQKIIDQIPIYQGKFIRNRQLATKTRTTVGISPEPYLDLISNPFNKREWHFLSLGILCSIDF